MTNTAPTIPAKFYEVSPKTKTFFGVCLVLGVVSFVLALFFAPSRAWPNFLLNYFFFLILSLSGAFFIALQHITNAYWSVTVRRLAEALVSYLPVALVLGVILVLGSHNLYEWTHHEVVAKDPLLTLKSSYLNLPFFILRLCLFFSLWIFFSLKMRKNSLNQDITGEHRFTLSNIKLSAIFIPLFAITFTLCSFDLVMSLEPHWFSTIFGVYCFSGLFYGGLSLLAYLTICGSQKGVFTKDLVNENHIHDIGKLMFAFTVFWGYILFSQLMLQWYANLPEEIPYYLRRFDGSWWDVGVFLFLVHFVLPFFLLLPRQAKRSASYLKKMACLMLFSQWVDVYYMVMPVFFKKGPVFGWIEIGVFLGFLGLFGLTLSRFLNRVPSLPIKDPRLTDCLAHVQ